MKLFTTSCKVNARSGSPSAVLVLFASTLLACDGSTGPSDDPGNATVVGNWTLATISTQSLPFIIAGGGFGDPTLIPRASLTFLAGTGLDSVAYQVGNQILTDTLSFTYSQRRDTVFLTRPPFVDTGIVIIGSPKQLKLRRNFKVGVGGFPSGRVEALYIRP